VVKPIVAIVGRPNVGKSTLFNRLVGERRAIVQNEPGTTRDRVYGTAEWIGVEFTVIDTGGLQEDDEIVSDPEATETYIAQQTREQASAAITEADVIVFMVDREVARASYQNAHYLADQLTSLEGFELACDAPFFNEFTVKTPGAASDLNDRLLLEEGIIGGYDPGRDDESLADHLILAATELNTKSSIDRLVAVAASSPR
jgi:GTP-binding protein